jgi:hypothetical protein
MNFSLKAVPAGQFADFGVLLAFCLVMLCQCSSFALLG